MNSIKNIIGFLRWHLIAVRYVSRLFNASANSFRFSKPSVLSTSVEMNNKGYATGPTISNQVVDEIMQIYSPRISAVVEKETGAPFSNLILESDLSVDDPIMKLVFSKEFLNPVLDYFGGKGLLDSIQLLYSWPTEGKLRESQMWHKDYGDAKSFHSIIYLNDVITPEDGPFVFIDKNDSKKIRWSPFIRRIKDDQLLEELDGGEILKFYGAAGQSIFVDPAKCYHFGSRCKTPRYAIFLTFNSSMPFVPVTDLIRNNKSKILDIAVELRPDLSKAQLQSLIN